MECSVHHVPGRIRFKIPGLRDDNVLIGALPRALRAFEGVGGVEVRPASNSLIVHYDPIRADSRVLVQSVTRGLTVKAAARPVNQNASAPVPQRGTRADDFVIGSVRQMGVVFGRTAFKVALEQAVRGGLNSLFRVSRSWT